MKSKTKTFLLAIAMVFAVITSSTAASIELINDENAWHTYFWGNAQAEVINNSPFTGALIPNGGGGGFWQDGIYDWTNATSIRITYTSSHNFLAILGCEQFIYYVQLPAGTNRTEDISLLGVNARFTRSDRVNWVPQQITMNQSILSQINGAVNIESVAWGATTNITITSILVAGLQVAPSHSITVTAGAGGTISPSGDVLVREGRNQTFTITPENGYIIQDVKVNGVSRGKINSYTFQNTRGDSTIEASFRALADFGLTELINDEFVWHINRWGNENNVFASKLSNNPLEGSISVRTPHDGVSSANFDLSLVDFDWSNVVNINMTYTSDREFFLNLWDSENERGYMRLIPRGTNASINFDLSGFTFWDASQMRDVPAHTVWDLSKITHLGINTLWGATSTSFQITSLSVAGLEVIQNTHKITATAGAGGTISPSGEVVVRNGANRTFTFTPDRQYVIEDVKINGVSRGRINSYTFQNITGDSTIEVRFEMPDYTELISDEFVWHAQTWGANTTATITSNNPLAGSISSNNETGGGNISLNVRDFDLTDVSRIDMTYTSDRAFLLILWDDENRRDFYRVIPAGTNANISFDLSGFIRRTGTQDLPAHTVWDLSKITDVVIQPLWVSAVDFQITSLAVAGLKTQASENVEVIWDTKTDFVYNGRVQAPTATAITADGIPLQLTILGGATNANSSPYVATAILATTNSNFNFNLTGATKQFTIAKAQISPILNIQSVEVGNALAPSVIGNLDNGAITYLFATSENGEFSAIAPTAVGTHFAKAMIAETENRLGAQTPVVSFAILSETAAETANVVVVWEDINDDFIFNGSMQAPSASATLFGLPVPLEIIGGINAGEHRAIARLATPNNQIILTNSEKPFTIEPRTLRENAISPISHFSFTGRQITPNVEVKYGEESLTENVDFKVFYGANISGMGSVEITGIGNYTGILSRTFAIASSGTPIVSVVWGETQFTFNGEEQYPTATAMWNDIEIELEIIGKQTNAGSHVAVAQLKNPALGIILVNNVRPFTISPKKLTVSWSQPRTFVYNKMVQVPIPSVEEKSVMLRVVGGQSEVGNYTGVLAPFAQIISANANNFTLDESTVSIDYSITPRTLLVSLTAPANDTILLNERDFAEIEDIISHLSGLIRFIGFATNTETQESDNEDVLTGAPSISLSPIPTTLSAEAREQRSNETERLYSVNINTSAMSAKNYTPQGQTGLVVRLSQGSTSIRRTESRDNRHGIVLENAIVSDVARISVITPEPATINLRILDNLGNVVFTETATHPYGRVLNPPLHSSAIVWNLTNTNGRFVANGTYLIVVETQCLASPSGGRRFTYSARIGVNR
ncbi:MAG: hypothetical protein FWE23_06420 [Chitinivibrionia bacterium]|nr:hypothetical protein [Chitinivibrionia bacterium]